MMYLGNYASGTTVDFMWSTNGADGASITRATNGTISVYKGNSTTQTTTGVTDTEDFDGLTGIHHCRIATSDSFYATGNDYMVVLSGATIDGKTVNSVLAHFSIQKRYMRGTDSANTTTPPTAADIADEVWFTPVFDHTLAGTMGALQEAAASEFFDHEVTDTLEAGTIGELLLDFLNAGGGSVDVTAIDGSTTAADNLRKWFDGTGYNGANNAIGAVSAVSGTVNANMVGLNYDNAAFTKFLHLVRGAVAGVVASGTNTTTVVTTGFGTTANGFYVGKTFIAVTGNNAGQGGKLVTAYDGATKRLTIEALTSAMTAGDTFVLVG